MHKQPPIFPEETLYSIPGAAEAFGFQRHKIAYSCPLWEHPLDPNKSPLEAENSHL